MLRQAWIPRLTVFIAAVLLAGCLLFAVLR